jgi:hypothetical protein
MPECEACRSSSLASTHAPGREIISFRRKTWNGKSSVSCQEVSRKFRARLRGRRRGRNAVTKPATRHSGGNLYGHRDRHNRQHAPKPRPDVDGEVGSLGLRRSRPRSYPAPRRTEPAFPYVEAFGEAGEKYPDGSARGTDQRQASRTPKSIVLKSSTRAYHSLVLAPPRIESRGFL